MRKTVNSLRGTMRRRQLLVESLEDRRLLVANPIAHWPLDDGAGTTASDISGNGHDGTLVSGPTWSGSGQFGGALDFDGTNDQVEVSSIPQGWSAITVAAWVKNDTGADGTTNDIMSRWNFPSSRSWVLTHHKNDQYFFEISGKSFLTGGTVSTDWTHVAGTYDQATGTMRLYVNGSEVASQSGLSGTLPTSSANVILGGQQNPSNYFDGLIDDARIYDRELTPTEVATLATVTDTTPPVVSNPAPSGTLPSGTTLATLSVATDEDATVRYDTVPGTEYANMPFTFSTTGGTAHSQDVAVTDGQSYTFYARAEDGSGNATTSDTVISFSVAAPDLTPPSVPSGLQATAISATQIDLTWNASTDPETGVANYRVFRDNVLIAQPTGTSFSDTGLTPETTYSYEVSAVNGDGDESARSAAVNETTPEQNDLQAHWTLDEGSGSTAGDISGNGNDGTLEGGPTWTPNGLIGGALDFDGTNDRVEVTTIPQAWSAITVAAWVKNDTGADSTTNDIASRWNFPSSRSWVLTHHRNNQYFWEVHGKGAISGGSVSTEWTHVAGTYDQFTGTMRLYVNGTQVATQTGLSGSLPTTTSDVFIGGQQDGRNYFDGRIDDVRLYDRALTVGEIATLAADVTPPTVSNGLPTGVLPSGTTNVLLSVETNEDATVKYDTSAGTDFGSMPFTFSNTGGTTHTTTVNVTDGQSYTFYVRAEDGSGNATQSDYLISFSVAAPDATPPSVPGGLQANAISGTQIDLSWNPSSDPETGVNNYRVFRDNVLIAEPTGTSFSDTGLTPETTYSYEVSAVNGDGGESNRSAPVQETTPAQNNLQGHWTLDDGSGTVADDSSNNNLDGVLVNGPVWRQLGLIGGALEFDGSNDYVEVSSVPQGWSSITVAGWVKNDTGADSTTNDIVSRWDFPSSRSWVLTHHKNNQYFWEINGKGAISGGTVGTAWTHVAGTYDAASGVMRLYVDGVQVASQSGLSGALPNSTANLIIGSQADGNNYFDGVIDDVRLYDRELTSPEIAALAANSDTAAPIIDVWYGNSQDFGSPGNPQNWVNVLGNVMDASDITSLSFTLNGGSAQTLSIGPDDRRLERMGDFNVEIDYQDLNPGANTVVITAVDSKGNTAQENVTVNWTPSTTWPIPYTVDWSTFSNPADAVQIVDGEWELDAGGLRISEFGYDRVFAIGDLNWDEYEVTVPITIDAIDPSGFQPPSTSPGFGLTARWTGHTDSPVVCPQPHCGWQPSGAGAWYDIGQGGPLKLDGNSDPSVDIDVGDTYYWKFRVENIPGGTLYSLRVWESGQSEPGSWNITRQRGPTDEQNGSMIFIAHHVDATFGDITVSAVSGGASGAVPGVEDLAVLTDQHFIELPAEDTSVLQSATTIDLVSAQPLQTGLASKAAGPDFSAPIVSAADRVEVGPPSLEDLDRIFDEWDEDELL